MNPINIHKYAIGGLTPHEFSLSVPLDWMFLTAGLDAGGQPAIWAEVNTNQETLHKLDFALVWTDGEVPPNGTYLATYAVPTEGLVCHLYQLTLQRETISN